MDNLNKEVKLQYFEKLSVDGDTKPFWKACKPYFSSKNTNIQENIMLLEKDKFLLKQKDFFNEIFCRFRKSHSQQYALFLSY